MPGSGALRCWAGRIELHWHATQRNAARSWQQAQGRMVNEYCSRHADIVCQGLLEKGFAPILATGSTLASSIWQRAVRRDPSNALPNPDRSPQTLHLGIATSLDSSKEKMSRWTCSGKISSACKPDQPLHLANVKIRIAPLKLSPCLNRAGSCTRHNSSLAPCSNQREQTSHTWHISSEHKMLSALVASDAGCRSLPRILAHRQA